MSQNEKNKNLNRRRNTEETSSSSNPYAPPHAAVYDTATPDIPDSICNMIRYCWIAGIFHLALNWLFLTIGLMAGIAGINLVTVIEGVIRVGLLFGIYRNSRVAAVLMLVFFVGGQVVVLEYLTESGFAVVFTGLLIWFYALGVIGTFQRQRFINTWKKDQRASI